MRARTRIPYLGICLGMQLAIVEFGRHVLGLKGANSTEFNRATNHPVIALITEWQDLAPWTAGARREIRAGRQHAPGRAGGAPQSRHLGARAVRQGVDLRAPPPSLRVQQQLPATAGCGRHEFLGLLRAMGWWSSSSCESHPWFVASQFHPEFTSTPRDGHPLFTGFVRAARAYRASLQPARATA